MDLTTTLTLKNGCTIPMLGLGVFRSGAGKSTQDAVRWALEAGYRHIDTAAMYRNEDEVGEGLRASGVPRDEVFITTKVWSSDLRARDFARSARFHGVDFRMPSKFPIGTVAALRAFYWTWDRDPASASELAATADSQRDFLTVLLP